ncbi:MAG: SGNH/GDSL hydrolase family protein [Deltaproteobacteria bacterium]|nr:SGNH/GDSL hydrolase family protein [Deltaproteobacteria bacterium]
MKKVTIVSIALFMAFTILYVNRSENMRSKQSLPHILIIGDSISIGYTLYLTEMFKDEAIVEHNEGNAQHTGTGLKNLDRWIGATKWDVIYFNWGLWDLCYRHPDSKIQGFRDKVNGTITTNLEQYMRNLDLLVLRLKKTDALLIWAQTTVVPEGEAGRFVGDDKKYNEVAATVMKKHGIIIDDLYTLTKGFAPDLFVELGNVHYTKDGYKKIAAHVADKIRTALKGEHGGGSLKEAPQE